jgi:hypothetical protein
MFARVASFEGGDVERLRQMSDPENRPTPPEGVRRVMLLQSDGGDRRLFITLFDSREAIAAAEERFESMGDEIPEDVRGRRLSVDVYEVLADEAV